MRYFKFGEDFIKWTQTIYNNPIACIVNNGNLSKFFPVQRSVKQGGPCSAYYFLVIAEILALELRYDNKLQGVAIDNIEKLIGQYADDIDLYLWGTKANFQHAFQLVEHFTARTGFKISYDKTTLYRIGSLKTTKAAFCTTAKVKWESKINMLGVNIVENTVELNDINYKPIIDKIPAILAMWRKRNLSLPWESKNT